MKASIVLVTANLGGIDTAFPLPRHEGVDAVYFADFDVPPVVAATWDTVIRVSRPAAGEARLTAKHHKCQIHKPKEIAGYRYLAWADACFRFKSLTFLPELASVIGERGTRAAFIPHPDRRTVAEEYAFILDQIVRGNRYLKSRYEVEPLERERRHFAARYDLTQLRLWCGGLWLLPNSPAAWSFLNAWWDVVKAFSIFDQTAITPLLEDAGIEVIPFDVDLYNNSLWERVRHA
jgi:hypothetical protein